jgi:hypothetical protein
LDSRQVLLASIMGSVCFIHQLREMVGEVECAATKHILSPAQHLLVGMLQDCLQLLISLLCDNPSNQLMFRESGYLSNLHRLLRLSVAPAPAPSGFASTVEVHLSTSNSAAEILTAETASNVCKAVQLVCVLLSPLSTTAADPANNGGVEAARGKVEMATMCLEANHALLAKTPLQEALLELALLHGQGPACGVRCSALHALRLMVEDRHTAQDAIGNATVVARGSTVPAIQVSCAKCHV